MAKKMWVQMGLPFLCEKLQKVCGGPWDGFVRKKTECCELFPEESAQMEKYEMVALITNTNDER